jgi:hypothetical protein
MLNFSFLIITTHIPCLIVIGGGNRFKSSKEKLFAFITYYTGIIFKSNSDSKHYVRSIYLIKLSLIKDNTYSKIINILENLFRHLI